MSAPRGQLPMIKPEVEFYGHQTEGVRWIAKTGSVLLADEMGLGKSLQALTVAAIDHRNDNSRKTLVITLATLKGNWLEEIAEHTNFSAVVLEGTKKRRDKQLAELEADVLIVNYEQVVSHLEQFNAIGFYVVIYDEAHAIKNRTSKRSKACLKLEGKRHILVTGSPMLNHVDDLWTLLNRVDPKQFPKYWTFRNRYCVFGGFQGRQIVSVKNEAELHRKLSGIMLRRLKVETLDLPEKQTVKVWVDLDPLQRKLYREALEEQQITLPHDPNPMQIENALVRFLRLKEICGSAGTIEGYEDVSTKLDRAVELVSEIIESGEPVVVFTQFRSILHFLTERLKAVDIPTWQLHGHVPAADRVPTIQDWTGHAEVGQYGALCCMYQVGGVGLNMTAASKIILVDKLFVPKLNEQAVDRVHRIGVDLTRPVQIFELLCRKTIEQRIERILAAKNRNFDAVVEGDSGEFKRELVRAMLEEEETE